MTLHGTLTRPGRTADIEVTALDGEQRTAKTDAVVTEEPLELRLSDGARTRTLAVTMRTPGNDFELAAGFAFNESILVDRDRLTGMTYCLDSDLDPAQQYNIVTIQCDANAFARSAVRLERHFTTNSSCGICGSAQLQSMRDLGMTPLEDDLRISATLLYSLPERMREQQRVFASTGGLHAAALFDENGECITVREDIGRHNAFDKLAGWGFLEWALAPYAPRRFGERACELRDRAKSGRGAHSRALFRLCTEQSRDFGGPRVQRHARRLFTRRPRERLHRHRTRPLAVTLSASSATRIDLSA